MHEILECTYGLMTGVDVRDIDSETRSATFDAATENGVETYSGRQYLVIDGVDLDRYERNPVVLDTHNRWEASAVVGKADISITGRRLAARVEFSTTQRAQDIYTLVEGGFLRAMSVGFIPREVQRIEEGESYKLGRRKIVGPAEIVHKWELYEISVVPVPADPDALKRAFFDKDKTIIEAVAREAVDAYKRLLMEDVTMPDNKKAQEVREQAEQTDTATDTRAATGSNANTTAVAERQLEELRRDAKAITPENMWERGQQLLVQCRNIDEYRTALMKDMATRTAPVGTPEPDVTQKREAKPEKNGPTFETVDDETLLRSLCTPGGNW